jgi:8-oxo-dGTP pyrophosphatase MutT (NUDIX family)
LTPGALGHGELHRRLRDSSWRSTPDWRSTADEPGALRGERGLIAAAVLVPLVFGAAPGVLLTRRCAHLSAHAGQVSLPGGRIDPGDAGPEAAALREAEEEIGLDPTRVQLIGRLDDHITGTGYRVTPVLGLLPDGVALEALSLRPSAGEVDAVFELPLAVLLDPAAPRRRSVMLAGRLREFWVWPHPQYEIWGATAAILVDLAGRLRQALGDA